MCSIIDVNVVGEALGGSPSEAGPRFIGWIVDGGSKLVVSNALLAEIKSYRARVWFREGIAAERVRQVADGMVDPRADVLRKEALCRSDDEHVIALAQVSRARLLYANDRALQQDFRDPALIDLPRGSVYSTLRGKEFTATHRSLLSRSVCADGR